MRSAPALEIQLKSPSSASSRFLIFGFEESIGDISRRFARYLVLDVEHSRQNTPP